MLRFAQHFDLLNRNKANLSCATATGGADYLHWSLTDGLAFTIQFTFDAMPGHKTKTNAHYFGHSTNDRA